MLHKRTIGIVRTAGRVLTLGIFILLCSINYAEARKSSYKVTAYAYNSCRKQTDSTPYVTAYSKRAKKGVTIAVSRDLKHLKHKSVRLVNVRTKKVLGVYRVEDTMGKRHRRSVDVFFGKDKKTARKFGKQKLKLEVLCMK